MISLHFWAHLRTINRHRALVRKYCFRLGLYWQGLTHDLSKYAPVEFFAGVKYFQGDHSPNDAQRKEHGYSASWLHHKGRNRHHFEYWTDYSPTGEGIVGVEMPRKYVAEMFCDRLAASKVYRGKDFNPGDPYQFYLRGKDRRLLIHPATAALLETMLLKLRDEGEDAAFAYIRQEILGKSQDAPPPDPRRFFESACMLYVNEASIPGAFDRCTDCPPPLMPRRAVCRRANIDHVCSPA